jgi:exodeoxyribonuclease VII large subunit
MAGLDTIILCRGGGSLEDLWAFNDERVVRAVAASPIPVICGVGHETDVTLCDLAADLRAATPTAAAELAAPATADCALTLLGVHRRMQRRVDAVLDTQAQRLDALGLRLARPAEGVRRRRQPLELLAQRLRFATRQATERQRHRLEQQAPRLGRAVAVLRTSEARRLESLAARLRLLDPQQVLTRGYAWLTDAQGRLLSSARQLRVGDEVQARLVDGQAALQVSRITPEPGP